MRGGRLRAALGVIAAVLAAGGWAREALEREVEEKERGRAEPERECQPQKEIFQLVLSQDEDKFIVNGKPEVANFTSAEDRLPRGCERWAGAATCCRRELFEQLGTQWGEEADRFAAVRDAYTHLVPDVLQPAVDALDGQSQGDVAKKIAEVSTLIETSKVGEAVASYIDNCEDPIRLHFAATTCELCSPSIGPRLLEGKYLEVNAASCYNLWEPCRNATLTIEAVVGKLHGAALKVKAVVDAGFKSQELARAQSWLSGAAHQTELLVKRVEFYRDQKEFCRRLEQRGYRYDPEDWGKLDLLHPGMAAASRSQEVAEQREDRLLAARAGAEAGGASCVHGWLSGSDCFCQPCWEGLYCEKPAKPGPMRGQPFSPLAAEDVTGSQQPFAIIGCQLPTRLEAQLARIKLLRVEQKGTGSEENPTAPQEDPCPLHEPSSGSFQELPLQVPVSATSIRLEYLVQAPQGSEGLFAVCFCQGSECLSDTSSWWRTGHVKVVRTDGQVKEEERIELKAVQEDPKALHRSTGAPKCDKQWRHLDMFSIAVSEVEGNIVFRCAKDFQDLLGPSGLKCVDGEWQAVLDQEESGRSPAGAAWDGQLPRCRWSHRQCGPPPGERRLLGGGSVEVQDGVATYTCPLGSVMLADAAKLKLERGHKVKLKAGNVPGTIAGGWASEADAYNVSVDPDVAQLTGVSWAKANASELWSVMEDSTFRSYCQENKTWAPLVIVHCYEKGQSARAVAVNSKGFPMSATSRFEAEHAHSLWQKSASAAPAGGPAGGCRGSCGGSFGAPEVRAGEADALVKGLLSGPAAAASSALELPALEASLLQLGSGGVEASAPAGVAGRRAALAAAPAEGIPRLDIQKWPVQFSQDAASSFVVDRCWTAHDCLVSGAAPPDTAAARLPPPVKKERGPVRHYHVRNALLSAGALVALLVLFLWSLVRDPRAAGGKQTGTASSHGHFMG